MSRTPMTPERFQSRDVKRRITKQENRLDYLKADFARMMVRVKLIEQALEDHDLGYQYKGK